MKHSHYQYPHTCDCPSCSNGHPQDCCNNHENYAPYENPPCNCCEPCSCNSCCSNSCCSNTCCCDSCCKPPIIVGPTSMANTYYSQYVFNDRIPSLSDIILIPNFEYGEKSELINPTTIQLEAGYIYQISYTVQGTPGANSYFQIIPYLNNIPQLVYASTGVSNTASEGNAHVSATFITNVALDAPATLSFRLSTSVNFAIGLLGAISIEVIG